MASSNHVLLIAIFSGLVTYGLLWLAGHPLDGMAALEVVFRYAPGFVFGALVLQLGTQGIGRRVALILACGLVWFLMYRLAQHLVVELEQPTVLACGIAGGLGAWLASFTVRLIKPRRLSLLAMLMAFVSGVLGGSLIGQGLLEPDESLWLDVLLMAGFVAWQAGVGGSLLLVDELGEHEPHF